ncbi:MAG: glycosyltransferase family 4 protein [Myxococcota bacterium]
MKRPHLLLVYPPRHDAATRFQTLIDGLSRTYRGTILTVSDVPADFTSGGFRVLSVPWKVGKIYPALARMLRAGTQIIRDAQRRGDPVELVSTYDPLRTGLLSAGLSAFGRTKFVVELNGDYRTPVNYIGDDGKPNELKRRAATAMQSFVLSRAHGIKALHEGLVDGVDTEGKVVRCFHSLVNLSPFEDLGETREVLFVGFPFYLKGVDLLIEAFKRVSDAHPNWRLKILGFYPIMTELNAHMAAHPKISHHRPVEWVEMPEHIGRCGILVLPSRSEAMGRVLLEAAAAGKPRIGSRAGGIPRVIEHERDGLLFDSEDVDTLTRHLDRLMRDSALRKRFGEAARARVQAEFSAERYFEHAQDLYNHVLGIGHAPRR